MKRTSNAFVHEWLRTDTFLGPNLTAKQRRRLRDLCRKFFEAGRRQVPQPSDRRERG